MLTVVPTPLGNLEDMPPRSLKALQEADAVYCEDTRRTRMLMSHFGIGTPLKRLNERDHLDMRGLIAELQSGRKLAIVSDGGMPGVSDPGAKTVALARQAGCPVTTLPGPSALTTALAGSGLPADSFVFLGFLPRSSGRRRRLLSEAAGLGRSIVVYESPFRVLDLLETALEVLGPEAQCCLARELSKIHEEWIAGSVAEVRSRLAGIDKLLGEFVAVFHPEKSPYQTAEAAGATRA